MQNQTNNLNIETKGLEFDLNIGRIDAIRTAFQINSSWMRTKSWRQGYSFYDNSEDAASARKPVAIYSQEGNAKLQTTICQTDFTCHSQYPAYRFCCYDDSTSYLAAV